jgi:hypothetical protein
MADAQGQLGLGAAIRERLAACNPAGEKGKPVTASAGLLHRLDEGEQQVARGGPGVVRPQRKGEHVQRVAALARGLLLAGAPPAASRRCRVAALRTT